MSTRRLERSRSDRMIGGVSGGIAHYFNADPTLIRLLTAAVVLFTGVGVLGYVVAWAIIPLEGEQHSVGVREFQKFQPNREQGQSPLDNIYGDRPGTHAPYTRQDRPHDK